MAVQSGAIPKGSVHRWTAYKLRRNNRDIQESIKRILRTIPIHAKIADLRIRIEKENDRISEELSATLQELNRYSREEILVVNRFLHDGDGVNVEEPGFPKMVERARV